MKKGAYWTKKTGLFSQAGYQIESYKKTIF